MVSFQIRRAKLGMGQNVRKKLTNMKRSYLVLGSVILLGALVFSLSKSESSHDNPRNPNPAFAENSGQFSKAGSKDNTNPSGQLGNLETKSLEKFSSDTNHLRRRHNPNQVFIDHTPEERVGFARKGRGPGG